MSRNEHMQDLAPLTVVAVGAVVAIVVTVLGVAGLPAWAVVASSTGVTLAAAALTHSLSGSPQHRVPALWAAVGFLAMTLAGSWIYVAVDSDDPAPANFVGDKDTPAFSLAPGGPPDTSYEAESLTPNAVNTADCYVTVDNKIWLNFGDGGWLRRSEVQPAPGYTERLPPRCAGS